MIVEMVPKVGMDRAPRLLAVCASA